MSDENAENKTTENQQVENTAATAVTPEYLGPSKTSVINEKSAHDAVVAGLIGAGVGGGVGALAAKKIGFVARLAEKEALPVRGTGALLFAAGTAVLAAVIGSVVGWSKGKKQFAAAKQQHEDLYARLNALEADKQQGTTR